MNITRKQLQRIIKEELEAVLSEKEGKKDMLLVLLLSVAKSVQRTGATQRKKAWKKNSKNTTCMTQKAERSPLQT